MLETVCVCVPRHLMIGKGSITSVVEVLGKIGAIKNPLIVTDKVMVEIGVVARLQKLLAQGGLTSAVYDAVRPDPTDEMVLMGIDILESGCHDAVIGLGGGSPIDAGKAIAVMARNSRDLQDYRPPSIFNGLGIPMLAIPTTAGTGTEVTHHTVLVHNATREKISCRGEGFVPNAAIIDYELSLSKPRRLIADNALDTLTHAIEAYVSRKATLYSDRLALDCMRLVAEHVEAAYQDPENLVAREALMLAATFGGMAFTNASIALVHAMSRPLGSLFHVPHGMSNAMLLPTVTDFSKEAAPERYADCARVLGLAADSDSDADACLALVAGLYAYNTRLEVPKMSAFGIDAGAYAAAQAAMAADALRSGAPALNPKIADQTQITDLYKKAWA